MTLGEFVTKARIPHLIEIKNEENRSLIAAVMTNSVALFPFCENEIVEWYPSKQNEMVQIVVVINTGSSEGFSQCRG